MLTKEQKWMNRLKRCLKDMPVNCELLINAENGNHSSIQLLKVGTMDKHDDYMFLNIDENDQINEGFTFENVIAVSESL